MGDINQPKTVLSGHNENKFDHKIGPKDRKTLNFLDLCQVPPFANCTLAAVRNPIDRAWSDVKRHLSVREEVERHFSSQEFADISFKTFANFYTSDYMMRCGQFIENIERWKRIVGSDQVLVYIFDDIIERPRELLEDVYRFLGISTRESVFNRNLYTRVIHRIAEIEMPRAHREFLFNVFKDEIRALNEMFGLHYS